MAEDNRKTVEARDGSSDAPTPVPAAVAGEVIPAAPKIDAITAQPNVQPDVSTNAVAPDPSAAAKAEADAGREMAAADIDAKPANQTGRVLVAVVLAVIVLAYSAGVVLGSIPDDQRIDLAHLTMLALSGIAVFLLIRPDALARLKFFQVGDVKFELQEVKRTQAQQQNALNAIGEKVLPLLLPRTERVHLSNLMTGNTADYRGGYPLRQEIRRLRSIGLITMRPGREAAQMTSGKRFNLADYVELTPLGKSWAALIDTIDKAEADANEGDE